jgi:adenosylcobyric acid synthase
MPSAFRLMPNKNTKEKTMLPIKHKSLMIQGTASTVGKSIICTALCRIFSQDGYNVNPFKSQNMSLNSAITPEGLEMGRAQVMQAEAAGKIPSVKMNPILLKPTSDRNSQVILNGSVYANLDAVEYFAFKPQLKEEIRRIHHELEQNSDIVVIEGAGSPAEININHDDLVNMGMAQLAEAPVILVGDIDKGGVFASLYGTVMLLSEAERHRIKGVIINKFRGSYELLEPGLKMLEAKIKIPVLGVIPFFNLNLEDEDSVTDWNKFSGNTGAVLDVAVIRLPYMSNFTDFNVFKLYEDVELRFIDQSAELGRPDLIIIPGSKSTIADLQFLQQAGLAGRITELRQQGICVFGICGGYQMLGMEISDPHKVETSLERIAGLGLLPVVTEFGADKTTALGEGVDQLFQTAVRGYEIHMGETRSVGKLQALVSLKHRNDQAVQLMDGAVSQDKRVFGTYLHGIFDNSQFTRAFLNELRARKGLSPVAACPVDYRQYKEAQYDQLARIVRDNLDLAKIYAIVEAGS